jgi:hypothetical protein
MSEQKVKVEHVSVGQEPVLIYIVDHYAEKLFEQLKTVVTAEESKRLDERNCLMIFFPTVDPGNPSEHEMLSNSVIGTILGLAVGKDGFVAFPDTLVVMPDIMSRNEKLTYKPMIIAVDSEMADAITSKVISKIVNKRLDTIKAELKKASESKSVDAKDFKSFGVNLN